MGELCDRLYPVAMRNRVDQLVRERAGVRVVYWMLSDARMAEWAHSLGVCSDHVLRSLVPPIPPYERRCEGAAPEAETFLYMGYMDAVQLLSLYERHRGAGAADRPTLLDFGCGCGRLTRFLGESCDVYGCDVSRSHVAWCQANLPAVKTELTSVEPPLPYADRTFDLLYALSVFSHLNEPALERWLAEFRRVLKLAGVVIVTTHGTHALEVIRDSASHQKLCDMSASQAAAILDTLPERRFVFRQYDAQVLARAEAGNEYGLTFIHPDYVRERWGDAGFQVLEYLPGALPGFQDIVVLRSL